MAFKVRRFEWGLALRLAAAIGFILLFLLSFVPQISTWLPSVLLPY